MEQRLINANALEYTCNADECGMLLGCNHCQYHVITEDEIDKAEIILTIPNNPTNGDMIKAMFPKINIIEGSKYVLLESKYDNVAIWSSWWNAPYKREVE